jgi:hypothetical protein
MTRRIRAAILAASLLPASGPAAAAVFCVGTSAELEAALATAEINGVDDDVRLRVGVYPTTSAAGFTFEPAFPGYAEELTISGGWSQACLRFGGTSLNTVVDAHGLGVALRLQVPAGALAIRRLTIRDASATTPALGALGIAPAAGAGGPDVVVDRVVFADNLAPSALTVISQGIVQILGCDFVHNTSTAAALWLNTCCSGTNAGYVLANTIAGNAVSGNGLVGGLYVKSSPGTIIYVLNNIFWDNEALDVALVGAGSYFFDLNIHGEIAGTFSGSGNLQVDPQFLDPVAGDHRLRPTSPARDSGDDSLSNLPLFDLLGVERPQDFWDRGAYELVPSIFADGFESGDTSAWSSTVP